MDALEKAAKLLEIQPDKLFREMCDAQHIEKRRREAWWTGYLTELWLPPLIIISCDMVIASTLKGS